MMSTVSRTGIGALVLAAGLLSAASAALSTPPLLLGSFPSAEEAMEARKALSEEMPGQGLSGLEASVVVNQAGATGLAFQLRIDGLTDRSARSGFCEKLSDLSISGLDCPAAVSGAGKALPIQEANRKDREAIDQEVSRQMEAAQSKSTEPSREATSSALAPIEMNLPEGQNFAKRHAAPPAAGASPSGAGNSAGKGAPPATLQGSPALAVMASMRLPEHAITLRSLSSEGAAFSWMERSVGMVRKDYAPVLAIAAVEEGYRVRGRGFKDRVAASGLCGVLLRMDIACEYDGSKTELKTGPVPDYRTAVEMAGFLAQSSGKDVMTLLATAKDRGRGIESVEVVALGADSAADAQAFCDNSGISCDEEQASRSAPAPAVPETTPNFDREIESAPATEAERETGAWFVQLSSFKRADEAIARSETRRIARIYGPLLGGNEPDYLKPRITGGIWRVVVGGFSEGDAQSLCGEIRAQGLDCVLFESDVNRPRFSDFQRRSTE